MFGDDDELKRLLEIVESGQEQEKPVSDVEYFILSRGIKPGNTRIGAYQFWYTYREFTENPVPQRVFFVEIKKMFKQHRHEFHRFYLLNPEPFDLTKDTYFKVRAELRLRNEQRKKNGKNKI